MATFQKKAWTQEYIDSLPDSCFAVIQPRVRKRYSELNQFSYNEITKTRRYFPYKDHLGRIDKYHCDTVINELYTNLGLYPWSTSEVFEKLRQEVSKVGIEYNFEGDDLIAESDTKTVELVGSGLPFNINKADEEKRMITGVVYEPDVVDTQGHSATADEIEKAAISFMASGHKLYFMHDKEKYEALLVENVIAKSRQKLGSQWIKKGTWYITTIAQNDTLWELIKAEKITGYSMGGTAKIS